MSRVSDATWWEEPDDITYGRGRDRNFGFASVLLLCDPIVATAGHNSVILTESAYIVFK